MLCFELPLLFILVILVAILVMSRGMKASFTVMGPFNNYKALTDTNTCSILTSLVSKLVI